MAKDRKRWVIYHDEHMEKHMERLRQEAAYKDHVSLEEITKRDVISEVLREKYVEYVDKQNNRARITTIVEELKRLTEAIEKLAEFMKEDRHDVSKLDTTK